MKPLHRRIVQRKIAEAREAKALRKQEEAAQAMLADGFVPTYRFERPEQLLEII